MIGPASVISSEDRFQLRKPIPNQIILTSSLDSARLALGLGTANRYISSFKQTGVFDSTQTDDLSLYSNRLAFWT